MIELYTLGAVVAGIVLGYFIGYEEGRQAGGDETIEALHAPLDVSASYTVRSPMTPEAFLNFDDMREEERSHE